MNKRSGISVQGGTKSKKNLVDIFAKSDVFKHTKPYSVHRLDKDTSGVFIIAKKRESAQLLTSLFRLRKVHKTYLAICDGKPKLKESFVYLSIESKIKNKEIKTKTFYKLISHNNKTSLLKFEPKTGKKHQLRIVAKNLGCPIVGDLKYNSNKTKYKENLKLNAYKLQFNIGEDIFNITSGLPGDFNDYLKLKDIKFDPKTI